MTDNQHDIILFEKVRKGCQKSFELLYENYAVRLFAYGKKISRNEQIVEDSIHDVFLKLWVKRKAITIKESFGSYIFLTFKRDLIERLKIDGKSVEMGETELDVLAEKSFLDLLLENQIEVSRESKVREAINSLPDSQREVIFLRFVEGMDTKLIAEQLGIQVGTVHNLFSKAYKNLFSFLQQYTEMLLLIFCFFN
jgi:RNA polymerase sigma factor (sigma-70 family)